MFELSLFPLNTVLFPGMPLPLHIFEARYKEMINRCIETNQPFGVVLIREGQEALGPLAHPHSVGCTARIVQVERMEDGRMNILAIGQERFQIVAVQRDQLYLVGQVRLAPIGDANPVALAKSGLYLRGRLVHYLEMLEQAGLLEFDPAQLPDDPVELAYLGAALLQVSTEQKQKLLNVDRAITLLDQIRALYRREVALLEAMLIPPGSHEQSEVTSFSPN